METKKKYTRMEKVQYYSAKVAKAEAIYMKLKKRLEYIMSDEYQDWDSGLTEELKEKKAR